MERIDKHTLRAFGNPPWLALLKALGPMFTSTPRTHWPFGKEWREVCPGDGHATGVVYGAGELAGGRAGGCMRRWSNDKD